MYKRHQVKGRHKRCFRDLSSLGSCFLLSCFAPSINKRCLFFFHFYLCLFYSFLFCLFYSHLLCQWWWLLAIPCTLAVSPQLMIDMRCDSILAPRAFSSALVLFRRMTIPGPPAPMTHRHWRQTLVCLPVIEAWLKEGWLLQLLLLLLLLLRKWLLGGVHGIQWQSPWWGVSTRSNSDTKAIALGGCCCSCCWWYCCYCCRCLFAFLLLRFHLVSGMSLLLLL